MVALCFIFQSSIAGHIDNEVANIAHPSFANDKRAAGTASAASDNVISIAPRAGNCTTSDI